MMWWKMFISSFLSSLWLLAIIPYGYCSIFTWSSSSSSLPLRPIRIGTRGSPLALAQAEETKNLLISKFPKLKNSISIVKIMTQGDSILNQPLAQIGGKGLFTKELDTALLSNEVDICVHSMKDVPTWLPNGTILPCCLQREETNDVFISEKYKSLSDLPDGAVIGSASLRRQAQLLAMNPTFRVINFRGNVQTRLTKLKNNEVDATLLALAGLKRLNMKNLIKSSKILTKEEMLPAVSQGAIGIQCRENDMEILQYLQQINHEPTRIAVECERSFLETLDGNCRTPIAGQANVQGNQIFFRGMLLKSDGSDMIAIEKYGNINEYKKIGRNAGVEIKNELGEEKFQEFQESYST